MKKLLGAALLCSALTGCAGLNSDFDCNKTATDQCLTTGEANKLAAQGKSLDDLTAEKTAKKPAGETLPALRNSAPVVNPFRPVSAAATGTTAAKTCCTAPSDHCAGEIVWLAGHAADHVQSCDPVPVNTAGRVQVSAFLTPRSADGLLPRVDTDDNFISRLWSSREKQIPLG